MNERFFDLKKEKQDRMINAALKVFALKGYEHASTDDIVKEAGISKGLLFHYFLSKLGLYSFVYDYSVRYLILELTTGVDKAEIDFFQIMDQVMQTEVAIMRNYPYMIAFLNQCKYENVSEALVETEEKKAALSEKYEEIFQRGAQASLKTGTDKGNLYQLFCFAEEGLLRKSIFEGSFQPEYFYEEWKVYFAQLKLLAGR